MNHKTDSILIIEDNREQARLWRDYLEGDIPAVRIDVANSTDEAINMFRERQYTIIILDIMMYPRDGWDTKEVAGGFWSGIQLHKDLLGICEEQGRGMSKMIIVTAIRGARTALYNGAFEYFEEYMDAWLDKPFNPKQLKEKVLQLLGREDVQSLGGTENVS